MARLEVHPATAGMTSFTVHAPAASSLPLDVLLLALQLAALVQFRVSPSAPRADQTLRHATQGYAQLLCAVLSALWLRSRCAVVLHGQSPSLSLCSCCADGGPESILAVKGLGIQLTTTRGVSLSLPRLTALRSYVDTSPAALTSTCEYKTIRIPLSRSNLFLPLGTISDVVLNEGISGWKIIYYLVVIQDKGHDGIKLRIGFPVRAAPAVSGRGMC